MKKIIEYSYIPEIIEIIKPYLQFKTSKIIFTIIGIILFFSVVIPLGISKFFATIKKGIEGYDFIIKRIKKWKKKRNKTKKVKRG